MTLPKMDSAILEELRKAVDSEKPLPRQVHERIVIAALINLTTRIDSLSQSFEDYKKIAHQERADAMNKLTKNPAIVLGEWARDHPKLFILLVLVGFVLINMWFVSDLRHPVLEALGLPGGLITIIPTP